MTTRTPPAPPRALDRRGFGRLLAWSSAGWTLFALGIAGVGNMIARFLFPNVPFDVEETRFKIGYPSSFGPGVHEQFKPRGFWVVRTASDPLSGNPGQPGIYALSTICTHLGCTPNLLASERKFKCPCHGSGFRLTGVNFEGPAPRPLERFAIGLADDGQIEVRKDEKFQQEKGEWTQPGSFLAC